MIIRGISDIRGIRSLNTRSGPISERNGYLKRYQLAAEKDRLLRKIAWVKRQKDQTEKRLSEIAHAMQAVEERAKRESASSSHAGFRRALIEY